MMAFIETHSPLLLRIIVILIVILVILNFLTFLADKTATPIAVEAPEQISTNDTISITPPKITVPSSTNTPLAVAELGTVTYVTIVDSCDYAFSGECVSVRSGPGTEFPKIASVRSGIVLRTSGSTITNGRSWHKIIFDEWLRYPERVAGDWYIASDYVKEFYDEGSKEIDNASTATTAKKIVVDRSEQKLYAYDGTEIFMEETISTGLELTPTPRGIFTIFKKTPSRYMQGPLPYLAESKYYDLPGVPWNLYFTEGGAVIHGTYWHNSFGKPYSHGCVNLPPAEAQKLYSWADLGTTVIVQD